MLPLSYCTPQFKISVILQNPFAKPLLSKLFLYSCGYFAIEIMAYIRLNASIYRTYAIIYMTLNSFNIFSFPVNS